MSDQPSSSANLKQFLTEEQLEIERQRRQADWERVRSAHDPVGNIRNFHLISFYSFMII